MHWIIAWFAAGIAILVAAVVWLEIRERNADAFRGRGQGAATNRAHGFRD